MQFNLGRYEYKHFGDNQWQTVSEKIVMEKLVDSFDLITPIISRMLKGEEIITSQGIYRKVNS
jgi:hypothetical protein